MLKSTPYTVHAHTPEAKDIEVISICDWEDEMGFDYLTPYKTMCEKLAEYLKEHPDTTYYAAPREEFSKISAAYRAERDGFTKVIVEDLS